jgi:hypothetical protein
VVIRFGRIRRNVFSEIDSVAGSVQIRAARDGVDSVGSARAIRELGCTLSDQSGVDLFDNGFREHRLGTIDSVAIVRRHRSDDQRNHAERPNNEHCSGHHHFDQSDACLRASTILVVDHIARFQLTHS